MYQDIYFINFDAGAPVHAMAKIFTNGRSQAVRSPAAFRFDVAEVCVRQDPATGDVISSCRPDNWDGFVQALQGAAWPDEFQSQAERAQAVRAPSEIRSKGRFDALDAGHQRGE